MRISMLRLYLRNKCTKEELDEICNWFKGKEEALNDFTTIFIKRLDTKSAIEEFKDFVAKYRTPIVEGTTQTNPEQLAAANKEQSQSLQINPLTFSNVVIDDTGNAINNNANAELIAKYPKLTNVENAIRFMGKYVSFSEREEGIINARVDSQEFIVDFGKMFNPADKYILTGLQSAVIPFEQVDVLTRYIGGTINADNALYIENQFIGPMVRHINQFVEISRVINKDNKNYTTLLNNLIKLLPAIQQEMKNNTMKYVPDVIISPSKFVLMADTFNGKRSVIDFDNGRVEVKVV